MTNNVHQVVINDQVSPQVIDQVRSQVINQVRGQVYRQVYNLVYVPISIQVRNQFLDKVTYQFEEQL